MSGVELLSMVIINCSTGIYCYVPGQVVCSVSNLVATMFNDKKASPLIDFSFGNGKFWPFVVAQKKTKKQKQKTLNMFRFLNP